MDVTKRRNLVKVAASVGAGAIAVLGSQFSSSLLPRNEVKDGVGLPLSRSSAYSAPTVNKLPASLAIPAGAYVEPATYVIYQSGGTIYAVNGITGNVDYSGTDAATVINLALAALSNGGTLFIRNGIYSIGTNLTPNSYTLIVGESWNTILQATVNSRIILVSGKTGVEVHSLQVNGNGYVSNYDLIYFGSCTDCKVQDVYAQQVIGAAGGVNANGCTRVDVADSKFYQCYGYAVSFNTGTVDSNMVRCKATDCGSFSAAFEVLGASSTPCLRVHIIDCHVNYTGNAHYPPQYGMELCSYTYDSTIEGGSVVGAVNGLMVDDGSGGHSRNLGAIGVNVVSCTGYGICVYGPHSTVTGCTVYECTVAGITVEAAATGSTITGNVINRPTSANNCLLIYASNCTFDGNIIWGNNGCLGINFQPGALSNILTGNQISAPGWAGAALYLPSGANNNLIVQNVFIAGGTPSNSGTGNVFLNNPGYNPQGFAVTTPPIPATGVDATNTLGFPVRILILTTGTTTAYQITDPNGTAQSITTGLQAGQEIILDPAAKIRFTYTAAPTWKWYGT
jgi:hypothetical protein